jgi:hypothetical protein
MPIGRPAAPAPGSQVQRQSRTVPAAAAGSSLTGVAQVSAGPRRSQAAA